MNIKKIGLTALAGALVSVSANAAELTATGAAAINFTGNEAVNTGNGWTMSDQVTFTGSAEMDNGWTVSTSDRRPSSHFEHTVLVTNGDPEILTWRPRTALPEQLDIPPLG